LAFSFAHIQSFNFSRCDPPKAPPRCLIEHYVFLLHITWRTRIDFEMALLMFSFVAIVPFFGNFSSLFLPVPRLLEQVAVFCLSF
jgi:hypothetical protein